jgi:predicted TIM-barrel fold metal-dependent hydrolase
MVIDTHTHAWGPPSPEHPWVNESIVNSVARFDVDTVYDAEALLADMDRQRVDEAVVVGYPIVEWTDNWYTVEAATEYDRLQGVVMLDHFGEDAVERAAETLAAEGVVGMRLSPGQQYEYMWRAAPTDERATWLPDAVEEAAFWEVAREEDSVVTISVGAGHLDEVLDLVETYPDLTYVFDAYGPLSADAPEEHYEAFAEFATYDNVGVKASHTPYMSNEGYPYEDVHDVLHWVLEEFGRDRVAWGSDFPNVTQHPDAVTYAEATNWVHHVDGLSDRDVDYLTGEAWAEMAADALD